MLQVSSLNFEQIRGLSDETSFEAVPTGFYQVR